MNLFDNKFRIDNDGNFEADGHFHATKTIKVHDGFEITRPNTEEEETIFEIFMSGISTLSELPVAFENSLVFRTQLLENENKMQYVFWNSSLDRPTMVLNQGAPNRATVIERSLIVGANNGTRPLDGNYTLGDEFDNLAFDTAQYGADLGIEHDCEVLGELFVDQIHESSPGAGVSINENFKVINGEVYILNLAGQGNKPIQVDDNGRLYTLP
jgi:hypothetical protein